MISKEVQEHCRGRFNGAGRIIFLASDDRKAAFKKALPHFLEVQDNIFIGPNNNIWQLVVLPDKHFYGKPVLEAIVDTAMDEETLYNVILPACQARCIRMEFFN